MSLISDYMKKFNEGVKIKGVGENEEALNEIAVYKNGNLVITVDGNETGTNFPKRPYFKIYDKQKIARIRLDGSDYEYHSTKGKNDWELTGFKKDLVDILNASPVGADRKVANCPTTWEAIKKATELETHGEPCTLPDEMPNFKDLKFDKSRGKGRKHEKA